MLFAAFGALQQAFPDATPADLSWVLNAYTVVYATMLIPAGGLADAHGRKRVFMIGVTLFLIASAACGMADSVGLLIAARVVQALGAALLTPASLSIILDAFPKEKRTVAISLWGAVGGLAAAIGPEPRQQHRRLPGLAMGVLHQPAAGRGFAVVRRGARCVKRKRCTGKQRVDWSACCC